MVNAVSRSKAPSRLSAAAGVPEGLTIFGQTVFFSQQSGADLPELPNKKPVMAAAEMLKASSINLVRIG